MELLYVLKLEHNKYYVGKTDNLNQRYLAHVSGSGASWTKVNPPVSIHEVRPVKDAYDETNTTKEYMKQHGIDNVRGGAYCQISIPDDVKLILLHELRAAADTCYTCGSSDHFTQACHRKPSSPMVVIDMKSLKPQIVRATESTDVWECAYCDRTFTTKFGASVHEKSCKKSIEDVTCYRCGRPGHVRPDCYASRHVKGYYLDD